MPDIGGLLQGVGDILGGMDANSAAKYNAQVDQNNAALAEQSARVDEMRQRQESYRAISAMRAGYGASGVTTEGSPLDVLEASARDAELDAQLIRFGGSVKAKTYRSGAAAQLFEGKNAQTEGIFKGGLDIAGAFALI